MRRCCAEQCARLPEEPVEAGRNISPACGVCRVTVVKVLQCPLYWY